MCAEMLRKQRRDLVEYKVIFGKRASFIFGKIANNCENTSCEFEEATLTGLEEIILSQLSRYIIC